MPRYTVNRGEIISGFYGRPAAITSNRHLVSRETDLVDEANAQRYGNQYYADRYQNRPPWDFTIGRRRK